jgi:hypothetical protein
MTKSAVGISFGLFLFAVAYSSASRAGADEGPAKPATVAVALEQGASTPTTGERMIHDPLVRGASSAAADLAEGTWEEQSAGCTDPGCGHGVDGCGACVPAALPVYVPRLNSGWGVNAGVLLLQPSADNLGYAVLTTEENFDSPVPIASPYWGIEALDPDYEPGLQLGARYAFADSGNDFQANWQHLRTTTSDSQAVNQSTGQWISPFSQTGPPTAENYQEMLTETGVNKLLSATGEVTFEYDSLNLDFGQHVMLGSAVGLRLFGGLSYARLQETLLSSFYGEPPAPNAPFPDSTPLVISLDNTSTFSGVGPRFGFESTYNATRRLRFTGQLGGALLVGQKQPAEYRFSATAPDLAAIGIADNEEWISSEKFTQVVYSCDAKLGVGYVHPLANGSTLEFEAGYLAAVYTDPFGGYETNDNVLGLQIGSLSTASMRHTLSDFTLNGVYFNGGVRW